MKQWIRFDYGNGKFIEQEFSDWQEAMKKAWDLHDRHEVIGWKLINEEDKKDE